MIKAIHLDSAQKDIYPLSAGIIPVIKRALLRIQLPPHLANTINTRNLQKAKIYIIISIYKGAVLQGSETF